MNREDCLEKLEQLVLDENKTVTFKSLSLQLKIPLREAKLCLSDFIIQQEKESNNLNATYFLSGVLNKDGIKTAKVLVVSGKQLEKTKEEFLEITSCHAYSVSKNRTDECTLYSVDQLFNKSRHENREFAVIKHPNLVIKQPVLTKISATISDDKVIAPKKKETPLLKNKSSLDEKKNTIQFSKSNGVTTNKAESEKPETPNSTIQQKTPSSESKNQKSNTLASMWQKSEDKAKSTKSETSKPEGKGKTKSPQETKKIQKNSIMSMFSKQAAKNAQHSPKKTPTPVCEPVSSKKDETLEPEPISAATSSKAKSQEKKPSNTTNKKRKVKQRATKASSKQQDGSDSGEDFNPKKKKHRRIVTFDDSDSDSECEEAQDRAQRSLYLPEDPIEEDPKIKATPGSDDSEEPIPPTPLVLLNKGKKKMCKTVNKTFLDEDGFMVTKQETEIVLESESDEDPLPPKESKKLETPKKNLSSHRKQASLTSFFKQS